MPGGGTNGVARGSGQHLVPDGRSFLAGCPGKPFLLLDLLACEPLRRHRAMAHKRMVMGGVTIHFTLSQSLHGTCQPQNTRYLFLESPCSLPLLCRPI